MCRGGGGVMGGGEEGELEEGDGTTGRGAINYSRILRGTGGPVTARFNKVTLLWLSLQATQCLCTGE